MANRLSDISEETDLPGFAQDLMSWLLQGRFIAPDKIEVAELSDKRFAVRLYTTERKYSISCTPKTGDSPDGYLGATVSQRKPRAGETWTRGRDLYDGPYNICGFRQILMDIVTCELVAVEADIEMTADTEEGPSIEEELDS